MLFNSTVFAIFLPVVFMTYWLCGRHIRLQNLLIVVASYVFYGWWDSRFLILMAFTSAWSYLFGLLELGAHERSTASKCRLALSCIINLGILGYFKYFNFFIEQAHAMLSAIGFETSLPSLRVILPVGISFYTFQALSYAIDVYRRTIVPTKDPIAFFAFISFFPQLVAGPIERATNLLPQFLGPRRFDRDLAVGGCRQILWGLFKKVVVADTCAYAANEILFNPHPSTLSLWPGMICFAFQIYGDFSGYSDVAIGCSKLFGIRLMRNFNTPYFARDIAEFWRRWHISLTTWFRDYLYIPLGGSRCGIRKKVRNTFAIFLVSGFWHGASWTFIFWGAFHACCFLPLLLGGRNRRHVSDVVAEGRLLPSPREAYQMLATFIITVIGWTFFRAPDISTAFGWLNRMVFFWDLRFRDCGITFITPRVLIPVLVMIIIEWINRGRTAFRLPSNGPLRWSIYYLFAVWIIVWQVEPQAFIYFQF